MQAFDPSCESAARVANPAHRRVVDLSGDRTVGMEDPLSVGGVYEQQRAARRMNGPAFVRRDVSRLRARAARLRLKKQPADGGRDGGSAIDGAVRACVGRGRVGGRRLA